MKCFGDVIYIYIHIYIYLEAPLVHKNLYHFFLYHFEKCVRFRGCKKKVYVYFGPPSFLCPKGASRLKSLWCFLLLGMFGLLLHNPDV